MATHELTTNKSTGYVEWLQQLDQGLVVRLDSKEVEAYAVGDEVNLTTDDGEVFSGCSVYGRSVQDGFVFIAVS